MADVDPKSLTDEQLAQAIETTVREFLKNEGGAEDAMGLAADQELWTQFDSLFIMEVLVHLEVRLGVLRITGKLSPDVLTPIGRIRDVATKAIRAAKA